MISYSRKFSLLILLAVSLSACMPKAEKEEDVGSPAFFTHTIERTGAQAKIRLEGNCPKGTWIMKVNSESGGWDVEQNSLTNYAANSGVPVAQWTTDGNFTMDYPVPNPMDTRRITFKVKIKMSDGRISLYPAVRQVDYTMPAEAIPGYAMTSGGTFSNAGTYRLNGSAGMLGDYNPGGSGTTIHAPGDVAGMLLRIGLHGILYDDTL